MSPARSAARGSTGARFCRLLVRVLLVTAAAGALAGTGRAIRSIEIRQGDQGFVVDATVFAPVPPNIAWAVVTDFDHMAGWVPNLRESRVTARDAGSVTVEQRGVAKFLLGSIPYTSVRRMVLDPPRTVHAVQVEGNMRRYESVLTLAAEGAGTKLVYHIELTPSSIASLVLSKALVEREFEENLSAVIDEMERRGR